jgi:rhodanese-related sulfurtransferase
MTYFVYCRSGAISLTGAEIMRKNGFSDVIDMVGGI